MQKFFSDHRRWGVNEIRALHVETVRKSSKRPAITDDFALFEDCQVDHRKFGSGVQDIERFRGQTRKRRDEEGNQDKPG